MAGLPEWGVVFVWLMFIVVNGLGEEIGWRGYAFPMLRRRHGTLAASLLLVPIWAGWHLPLFFLLQETATLASSVCLASSSDLLVARSSWPGCTNPP